MARQLELQTVSSVLTEIDGRLYWKPRPLADFKTVRSGKTWNTRFANKRAGTVVNEGGNKYVKIWILGGFMYEHRLIWLLHNGEVPDVIDHIDGNGLNNNISNLRDGSIVNGRNIKIPNTNTSGVIGVHWCTKREKWVAQGQGNDVRIPLGRYESLLDAVAVRRSWEVKNGFDVRTDRCSFH